MFSQFAQNTVLRVKQVYNRLQSKTYIVLLPNSNLMFAFRNPGKSMLTPMSLQLAASKNTYKDHTVPSCPRQTNPGSLFPRTDF